MRDEQLELLALLEQTLDLNYLNVDVAVVVDRVVNKKVQHGTAQEGVRRGRGPGAGVGWCFLFYNLH